MLYYDFNLNGELAQVCQLEQTERELFVYNRFMNKAKKLAKYYAKKHDMAELECINFMSSAMYNKFLDLRSKAIEKAGVHYNAVEVLCMIRTLSQLKIAHDRANNCNGGEYVESSAVALPSFDTTLTDGRAVHFPTIYKAESTELIGKVDNRVISKCFDYVDILTMWDNRHARHEAKLAQALQELDSLTTVYEYTSDTHYLNMTDAERDRAKKAINKKSRAIARAINSIDAMTKLNGEYGTPETVYFHELDNIEVMRRVSDMYTYKHFEDIKNILVSDRSMTSSERVALTRFRQRYNIGENVTRADLCYLLQLN